MAIITLAKKELRCLFSSPIAYVFIAAFLFLSFWLYFSQAFRLGEVDLRPFFNSLPLLFIVFLPSVSMSQWAAERHTGTLELLMTLPVHKAQLILGKFLGSSVFLAIVLLLTTPLALVMSFLVDHGLGLDAGQIISGYMGIYLLGLAYLALGLFVSSLSHNQIIAFIISVIALFVLYILAEPIVTQHLPHIFVPIVQFMSFNAHFESLARGVVDSRDVIYFLTTTALFLYLNHVTLTWKER